MVSAAIAQRFRLIAVESRDDDDLVAERLERGKNRRQLELHACTLREPLILDDAVGMINDTEPARWFGRRILSRGECRYHCIQ